jgi:transposase
MIFNKLRWSDPISSNKNYPNDSFGVVFPCGHAALLNGLSSAIEDTERSQRLQDMVIDMLSEYKTIVERIKGIEKQLAKFVDESESGKILLSILGIGVINASAFLASIDKGQAFNSPREFAVWLGLTPKQHASGNISRMGGITKRGDRYLRKQLIHGARALVSRTPKSSDPLALWAMKLRATKTFNKVAVAMAHRLARLIWVLLTRQERYRATPAALEVSA